MSRVPPVLRPAAPRRLAPAGSPLLLVFGLGLGEMLLIVGLLVLLFGAKKLPGLARGLGSGIRNFKGELKNPDDDRSQGDGDGRSG